LTKGSNVNDTVVENVVRPERVVSGSWMEVIASNLDYHLLGSKTRTTVQR
jgi:hypothetical protein